MKRYFWIFPFVVIAGVALTLFVRSTESGRPGQEDYYTGFKRDYRIYSPEVPRDIDFAGEKVPTDIFYVSENIEREILVNTYWHSNTLLMFKRANRWFPVIEPILKKNNIPDDFKYLALVESAFSNVTSPSGAKGFWQILKTTGNDYGLEINRQIDERFNVEKATRAACEYLNDAYKILGNWTLVAAAYNMGMGGVKKQIAVQKASTYYQMSLNSETSRYVYRIIAVKAIFSNPEKYGFYLREKDLFPPLQYYIVEVDTTISDLAAFAAGYNISYKMLKQLNPWMLTYYLPDVSGKKYKIKIPKDIMKDYFHLRDSMSNEVGIFGDKQK